MHLSSYSTATHFYCKACGDPEELRVLSRRRSNDCIHGQSSRRTRCPPTKPAPPVTRIRGLGSLARNGMHALCEAAPRDVGSSYSPSGAPALAERLSCRKHLAQWSTHPVGQGPPSATEKDDEGEAPCNHAATVQVPSLPAATYGGDAHGKRVRRCTWSAQSVVLRRDFHIH